MLRAFEPWHLIVIGGIALLLFGAKRLPDSARSIGQSLRIFRSEMGAAKDGHDGAGGSAATNGPANAPASVNVPLATTAPAPAPAHTTAPAPIPASEQIAPAAPVAAVPFVAAPVAATTVSVASAAVPVEEPVGASRHSGV